MKKLWAVLNGHKRGIGGALVTITTLATASLPLGGKVAVYAGLAIQVVGWVHAGWKAVADNTDLEPLDGEEGQ